MQSRKSEAGERTRGFVLLDVVVAFAVVGLALSIVWLGLSPRTGPRGLAAAAYEAEAMMREARTAAERGAVPVAVSLDGAGRRLRSGARSLDLPRDVVAELATSSCERQRAILFRADGTSCSGILQIASASAALRITIDGVTGDVQIVAP